MARQPIQLSSALRIRMRSMPLLSEASCYRRIDTLPLGADRPLRIEEASTIEVARSADHVTFLRLSQGAPTHKVSHYVGTTIDDQLALMYTPSMLPNKLFVESQPPTRWSFAQWPNGEPVRPNDDVFSIVPKNESWPDTHIPLVCASTSALNAATGRTWIEGAELYMWETLAEPNAEERHWGLGKQLLVIGFLTIAIPIYALAIPYLAIKKARLLHEIKTNKNIPRDIATKALEDFHDNGFLDSQPLEILTSEWLIRNPGWHSTIDIMPKLREWSPQLNNRGSISGALRALEREGEAKMRRQQRLRIPEGFFYGFQYQAASPSEGKREQKSLVERLRAMLPSPFQPDLA